MVGIAHGEESVDREVLVAAHRVDNRMPIENNMNHQNDIDTKRMARPSGVSFNSSSSQDGRIVVRKDRVQFGNLRICKLVDGWPFWKWWSGRSGNDSGTTFLPRFLLVWRC